MISYFFEDTDFIFKGKALNNKWLRIVAESEIRRLGQISIIFCSDNYILDINQRYLQHDYFTDIITARQVPTGKHSPKIYFAAMQACGAQKENTIVVEDSFSAARTAHNAGFTVIGVYEKSEPEQKQMMEICDLYVKNLTQWKVEELI